MKIKLFAILAFVGVLLAACSTKDEPISPYLYYPSADLEDGPIEQGNEPPIQNLLQTTLPDTTIVNAINNRINQPVIRDIVTDSVSIKPNVCRITRHNFRVNK